MAKAKLLISTALLSALAAAASAEPGYLMITQEQAASVDTSHISVNTAIVEGDKAAAAITEAGKAFLATQAAAAPAEKPEFVIESIPVEANKRGRAAGGRSNKYPFDKLEVGQSFFIAATDANKTPAKTIASTVSSATARYAVGVNNEDGTPLMETVTVRGKTVTRQKMQQTRKFAVQSVEGGCRVGRVA